MEGEIVGAMEGVTVGTKEGETVGSVEGDVLLEGAKVGSVLVFRWVRKSASYWERSWTGGHYWGTRDW